MNAREMTFEQKKYRINIKKGTIATNRKKESDIQS